MSSTYHFRVTKHQGYGSVLDMDLPDHKAAEAKAKELAQILIEEARKAKRLIDFEILRVTDGDGKLVFAGELAQLARPHTVRLGAQA